MRIRYAVTFVVVLGHCLALAILSGCAQQHEPAVEYVPPPTLTSAEPQAAKAAYQQFLNLLNAHRWNGLAVYFEGGTKNPMLIELRRNGYRRFDSFFGFERGYLEGLMEKDASGSTLQLRDILVAHRRNRSLDAVQYDITLCGRQSPGSSAVRVWRVAALSRKEARPSHPTEEDMRDADRIGAMLQAMQEHDAEARRKEVDSYKELLKER